jgi:hypothetical protein
MTMQAENVSDCPLRKFEYEPDLCWFLHIQFPEYKNNRYKLYYYLSYLFWGEPVLYPCLLHCLRKRNIAGLKQSDPHYNA